MGRLSLGVCLEMVLNGDLKTVEIFRHHKPSLNLQNCALLQMRVHYLTYVLKFYDVTLTVSTYSRIYISQRTTKPSLRLVRPAKTQISLHIRTVFAGHTCLIVSFVVR